MTRFAVATLTGLIVSAGCASVSPPIRLVGSDAEIRALAGEWSGEYVSDGVHSRRGSISFTLIAGEGDAHGDVLMIPEGFTNAYERYRGQPGPPSALSPHQASETLTVQFVRVGDGQVSGVIDPYWDPDRECEASTTFEGRVRELEIEGTFRSTYSKPLAETTGHWKVTRRR
jgi:hypothetical protein